MLNFRRYLEASVIDPRGEEVQFAQRYPNEDYGIVVIDPQKLLPYWKMNTMLNPVLKMK
jgi:hypothetical protein